jgi:hypothetical protein
LQRELWHDTLSLLRAGALRLHGISGQLRVRKYAATKPGNTPIGLEVAHRELKISPAQFDEVAAELGRTLDVFKVPNREKNEVLGAFAAHKGEVTAGYLAAGKAA